MRRRVLILVSTLVALIVAGCATSQPATRETAEHSNVVAMAKSYRFDPVLIQVPAGTTVTWVNDDNFTHNVQFSGDLEWTSPTLKPGDSATHIFDTPGEYAYVCVFHSQNMHARVVVLPR